MAIRTIMAAMFLAFLSSGAPAAPKAAPAIAPETVAPAIKVILYDPPAAYASRTGPDWGAIQRFYELRNFRPAWLNNPATGTALAALENAAADGLDPAHYHGAVLAAHSRVNNDRAAARYDVALTASLLSYAHDLRRGQVNSSFARDNWVAISRPNFDPAWSLSSALESGSLKHWLASLPPENREYAYLKIALARFREIAAKGGWPKVPVTRKIVLEQGNPDLPALYARLAAEDADLAHAKADDLAALKSAVERFQQRNGLEADGVVGSKTIAALNISPAQRISQIEANMERWRWLPHKLPRRYIAVNVAGATLRVVADGNTVLTSRVIVGKSWTPTVIFTAEAEALTINPSWHVPASIVRHEILPKLRRNPAYLSRHHMRMRDGRVRQLPGPFNALGLIKVQMPNQFSSYMHDTNARKLFARGNRHLSHGCIRVQKIRPLASWLLTGSTQAGQETINEAIAAARTKTLPLDKKVPIFVLYWTATARADGTVEFHPDIYGRDRALIAALDGRSKEGAASILAGCITDCAG
jgi:murein L,D-transpeptidase YcbB/YkuD